MNPSDELHQILEDARAQVAKVIIGHGKAVDQALVCIFTGQHALLEGVPGVAKTLLVRTLARVLGCEFGRIQLTPDMMPSDITGMSVFDLGRGEFSLVRGPVFTEFLLADEINRAPAKTQAGLLQAMQERTVTIDRTTHALPETFTVFATQNPIEHEGTYPLPEAQKDRFMLRIDVGFPTREEEVSLALRTLGQEAPVQVLESGAVRPVLDKGRLSAARAQLSSVLVRDELIAYAVDIVRKTRAADAVLVGAGPRAAQALVLSSRAQAALRGRDFVTPDDVREMAPPVLVHRLALRPEYDLEGMSVAEVVSRVLEQVPVPK